MIFCLVIEARSQGFDWYINGKQARGRETKDKKQFALK